MKKGKAVESVEASTAIPLGIEYEQLSKNVEDKFKIKDMRNSKKFPLDLIENNSGSKNTTTLLMPGMLINYETNMFHPYPQSEVPYVDGTSWIGM